MFSITLGAEALTAALLLGASGLQLGRPMGVSAMFVDLIGQVAVGAFIGLASTMLVGGTWFAYHVKLATVQLTHLTMIAIGTRAAVLIDLPLL